MVNCEFKATLLQSRSVEIKRSDHLLLILDPVGLGIVGAVIETTVTAVLIDHIVANRKEGEIRFEPVDSVHEQAVELEGGIRTEVVQLHTVHRGDGAENEQETKGNKSVHFQFLKNRNQKIEINLKLVVLPGYSSSETKRQLVCFFIIK